VTVPWTSAATSFGPVAIAAPLMVACLLAAVGRLLPRLAVDVVVTATVTGVVAVDMALLLAAREHRVVSWVGGWTPSHGHSVGISLVADRLGAGLALLAAVLVLAALVYSWRYIEDVGSHYQVLLLVFLAGMTGFALSGDIFDMFVFFELMGAAAYALTGLLVEDRTAVQGALNFGIINSLGAYLTLVGIGVLYARYGALGLPQLASAMSRGRPDALVVTAFALICAGLLVKAAVVPVHFWTADAEAVAPTPVCLLFSAVMVELGLYGVARIYWTTFEEVLPEDAVRRALLVVGVLTAVVGAVMCFQQRHLKRLLAYSTIAHVGLFLTALGTLDGPGTTGAVIYALGHAGVKGSLFLMAGTMLNRYGSVDEVTLYGRGRDARIMPWLFVVGGLGLAALPPFGTGLGKAVAEEALSVSGYWFGPVLFVAVSAVTGGAVLRAGGRVYFGLGPRPRDQDGQGTDDEPERESEELPRVPFTMLLPIVVLLAGSLAVGAVPAIGRAVSTAVVQFLDGHGYVAAALQGTTGTSPAPLPEAAWTTTGVVLGLVSAALATGLAALALWAPRLPDVLRAAARPVTPLLGGLRRLHSGHVGDYVAWLFVGVAAFTALIGVPLL
jgi:multicomponent Na+:H+ antiporter subunit D